MGRASSDLLDILHEVVASNLVEQIKSFRDAGEPIPPALIAQAIKFLKDNGIDQPAKAGNRIDTLASALPDFEALEANTHSARR